MKFIRKSWHYLWDMFDIQLQFSSAFYLQTDGQMKVVNRTLGHMLRYVYTNKQQNWEAVLPKVEFIYNSMVNQSTGNTPFEIVYTCSLRNVYDLTIMLTIAGGSKAVNNVTEKALQIYAEV